MAVLLFSLSTSHDDSPICLNTMRCTLSLPPPLHNYITVDMLFNIVGHKIDGNYESWKYMGQNTASDRLAPGRGPSFPHKGALGGFRWSNIQKFWRSCQTAGPIGTNFGSRLLIHLGMDIG